MNSITVEFFAFGHEKVQSTHKTTFEITKEANLTMQGDCVIAVESTKGAVDLPYEFKKVARKPGAQITIIIEAGELKEIVKAKGSPELQFTHPTDLVVRKSSFLCDRTLAIGADKAAINFSRKFVEKMKDPHQKIKVRLIVESY